MTTIAGDVWEGLGLELCEPQQLETEKFRLGWWNTSLTAPGRRSKVNPEKLNVVAAMLRVLMQSHSVDVLFLGEIAAQQVVDLSCSGSTLDLEFLPLEGGAEGSDFNMAAVYKRSSVQIIESQFEYEWIGEGRAKIASRLDAIVAQKTLMTFFVAHWPSRIYHDEETQKREQIAQCLRRNIDEMLQRNENAKIVVVGDFNDEPYNASLSRNLLASRDVHRVRKNPRLLYNPFWRDLAPAAYYSMAGLPEQAVKGSCYHRRGVVHRWRIYDQMMFSAAFVGKGDWHLNEESTYILDHSKGFPVDIEVDTTFDHYPVVATLER